MKLYFGIDILISISNVIASKTSWPKTGMSPPLGPNDTPAWSNRGLPQCNVSGVQFESFPVCQGFCCTKNWISSGFQGFNGRNFLFIFGNYQPDFHWIRPHNVAHSLSNRVDGTLFTSSLHWSDELFLTLTKNVRTLTKNVQGLTNNVPNRDVKDILSQG